METFAQILRDIKYKNWQFFIGFTHNDNPYLYIEATTIDSDTGLPVTWKSRKWRISTHMTKTELVSTAFLALRGAIEHEAREEFTYKGKRIFGPHISVDQLVEVCDKVDVRG
jgi:hypothetical protein